MDLPPAFKIVLLVVVALTVLSFLGIGAMALFGDGAKTPAEMSVAASAFLTACTFGWQAGLGAILGLIGGKVTQ